LVVDNQSNQFRRTGEPAEVPAQRNGGPLGKEKPMVNTESWRISIEQAAAYIESQVGAETVNAVFAKYSATSLEDLSPCYYSEVFGELSAIEADLRN